MRLANIERRAGGLAIDGLLLLTLSFLLPPLLNRLSLGRDARAITDVSLTAGIALLYLGLGYSSGQTVSGWLLRSVVVGRMFLARPGFLRGFLRAFVLVLYWVPVAVGGVYDAIHSPPGRQEAGSIFLAVPLSFLIAALGCLAATWSRDRQSWHDRLAGTVVVEKPGTGSSRVRDNTPRGDPSSPLPWRR